MNTAPRTFGRHRERSEAIQGRHDAAFPCSKAQRHTSWIASLRSLLTAPVPVTFLHPIALRGAGRPLAAGARPCYVLNPCRSSPKPPCNPPRCRRAKLNSSNGGRYRAKSKCAGIGRRWRIPIAAWRSWTAWTTSWLTPGRAAHDLTLSLSKGAPGSAAGCAEPRLRTEQQGFARPRFPARWAVFPGACFDKLSMRGVGGANGCGRSLPLARKLV